MVTRTSNNSRHFLVPCSLLLLHPNFLFLFHITIFLLILILPRYRDVALLLLSLGPGIWDGDPTAGAESSFPTGTGTATSSTISTTSPTITCCLAGATLAETHSPVEVVVVSPVLDLFLVYDHHHCRRHSMLLTPHALTLGFLLRHGVLVGLLKQRGDQHGMPVIVNNSSVCWRAFLLLFLCHPRLPHLLQFPPRDLLLLPLLHPPLHFHVNQCPQLPNISSCVGLALCVLFLCHAPSPNCILLIHFQLLLLSSSFVWKHLHCHLPWFLTVCSSSFQLSARPCFLIDCFNCDELCE